MAEFSSEELLKGILGNNGIIIRYIYKSFFHKIRSYIIRNSGNYDEARDIFQEAIIVIFRKLKDEGLVLHNCSFETYLFSVCRLLWLKQLEKRKKSVLNIEDTNHYSETVFDEGMDELIQKNERYRLFQDHFQQLGKECQQILQLFFEKHSFKQITEIMGLASENYTKKRKHQCKEHLIQNIKKDANFKNLSDYDF
ncbi:MAG TPA: sigma-70 family RNA polymerase sigma factor [Prolixibacteraceae bacterium]|nr:sigma-70 family RNA polymerase sigma factor [Prolixibacteraceae bacterium]